MAVEEFLAALEDHEVGSPQPGDRVRGSDHGEARRGPRRGEVERLYRTRPVELGGHPRLAGASRNVDSRFAHRVSSTAQTRAPSASTCAKRSASADPRALERTGRCATTRRFERRQPRARADRDA